MSQLTKTKAELVKLLTPIQIYCNSQNYNNAQTLHQIIEAVANWHIDKMTEPSEPTENVRGLFDE